MTANVSLKHFIHNPSQLLAQALRSLPLTNPSLVVDEAEKVVRHVPESTAAPIVGIISGGGAGHEPAFAAYVGRGLLSAAVSGTIFASPNASQVLHAIESIDTTKGVLVTVMNYTGDVLNFGVAVERARARNPSLNIEMLVVGDDVGVPRSQAGKVGRRGIAGTCLIHKITAAAAAQGQSLELLVSLGRTLSENLVSLGVSLDRVHVPGQSAVIDTDRVLQSDEVELGMGIHNEAGSGRRRGGKAELPLLVSEMLEQLISQDDAERGFLQTISQEAILLINNLGGLSPLELAAITTEVAEQLQSSRGISLPRIYSGTFMTSLNGPGFSVSLLFLQPSNSQAIIALLDLPTGARGWTAATGSQAWTRASPQSMQKKTSQDTEKAKLQHRVEFTCDIASVIKHLEAGLRAVIAAEPEVTRFDSIVGDGDCGTTLKRGAEELLDVCHNAPPSIDSLVVEAVAAVERSMDGTSGALYSIFANALYAHFSAAAATSPMIAVDRPFWIDALVAATGALSKYTPATKGDRTLMDALIPFQEALLAGKSLPEAAMVASEAADATKFLAAKLGRAVYVGGQESWVGTVPDPGAWGLSRFFTGLASAGG